MAQDTEQDFGNDEEKDRAGWPVSLIALLIAAGAAGGGYWIATKAEPPVSAPKVEATTQQAPAEVKVAATQTEAAKPVEKIAATSNSVEVSKSPDPAKAEVAAAPEVKPVEPVKVEAAAPAKVEEPKAVVEAPKVEEPKAAAAPAVEPAKPQETQVAVAAPEPAPETPKAVEPAPAAAPAAVEAPSFDTVRVEPTGDAVIAGRAAPGAEVVIKLSGKAIGKAMADATGAFAFVSDQPLPAGAAALSLETTVGGKTIASEQTVAVAVKGDQKSEPMVALVKPDEPTKIIQAPKAAEPLAMADSVKLDAVDYDAAGNIIFSGRGRPSAVVRLYIDNAAAGEVKADDTGRWMFAGTSAVAAGTHMLRADEIGPDGKVSSRIELPFLREEPAKVAAAAPAAAEPAPAAAEPAPAAVAATPAVEPAAETQVAAAAPEPARMVIQPGNSLWKLSRQVYGKGIRYTVIYEANKDQIRNPDLIYPGQVFVMPTAQP